LFFFNPNKQNYFSRSPVSSDEEAIYVKGGLWRDTVKAYMSALLASGFNKSDRAFTPCPLGTFKDVSTKGVDGCQNCPPGNIWLLLQIPVRRCEVQLILRAIFCINWCFKSAGSEIELKCRLDVFQRKNIITPLTPLLITFCKLQIPTRSNRRYTTQEVTAQKSTVEESILFYIIDTEISSRKKDYIKIIRKMH